ncbi:MAG: tRNA pseudouridine(54/55) synthase Pus10 [Crenarchaeota archaeon]|nr:tRNA pseudouridine(54/55) synthase Pus10 [Thermoproteota archaeon]
MRVVGDALEVIKRYPLCDHCLGSLFARLGRGLGNEARGAALRRSIIMELDRMFKEGEISKEEMEKILSNFDSDEMDELAEKMNLKLERRRCYVCGGRWEELVEEWARKVAEKLKEYEFDGFLVGCSDCGGMVERQREIISAFRLPYAETVKNSFKREVGKRVKEILGKEPDFEDPEIVAIMDLREGKVELQIKPVFVYGRYKKVVRNVSQSKWKYPYSVEEALERALKDFGGEEVILHGSGREDVDVRALGTGRPFVAEIRRPKRRRLPIEGREYFDGKVYFKFERYVSRDWVERIKTDEAKKEKVYLAIVYVPEGIEDEELKGLEEFFKDAVVSQRTPRRVLHRRADLVRERKVFWVKARRLNSKSFEALIKAQGGLYIKELVSGDGGRTEPSFSSFLGKEARCASLDVVWISEPS